nr:Unconventional myosin-Vb [Ipomoea batatas]
MIIAGNYNSSPNIIKHCYSLLSKDKCTVKNGEYVKTGLGEIERWCGQATEEYVGSSWDDLKHVRQAVGFLVCFLVCFMTK